MIQLTLDTIRHRRSHFATMNSERLQRVLTYLTDAQWHSTMDIIQHCNVCAVNSIIWELRSNGYLIDKRRMTTPEGKTHYEYKTRVWTLEEIEAAKEKAKRYREICR